MVRLTQKLLSHCNTCFIFLKYYLVLWFFIKKVLRQFLLGQTDILKLILKVIINVSDYLCDYLCRVILSYKQIQYQYINSKLTLHSTLFLMIIYQVKFNNIKKELFNRYYLKWCTLSILFFLLSNTSNIHHDMMKKVY